MKTLVSAAAIVLGLCSSAQARPWWALNFSNGRCELSQISPAQAQVWLRSNSQIEGPPETKIFRESNGDLGVVVITATYVNGQQGVWTFTTTPAKCEGLRQILVSKGELQDPGELQ